MLEEENSDSGHHLAQNPDEDNDFKKTINVRCEIGLDQITGEVTFNGLTKNNIVTSDIISNNFIDQYQRVCGPRMLVKDEKNELEAMCMNTNKHIQAILQLDSVLKQRKGFGLNPNRFGALLPKSFHVKPNTNQCTI